MINVTFSDTNAGCLKIITDPDTGVSFKSADILRFNWMLDIGTLQEGINSKYRKSLPGKMIMRETFFCPDEEGIPGIGALNTRHLNRLKKHLQNNDPIRVWYADDTESLCGLFFLCTLFKEYDAPIYALEAPRVSTHYGKMYFSNGWGCFKPEEMEELIPRQRLMGRQEICAYAERWEELVKENALLRVSVNGIPISVDADFFDRFIEQNLPDKAVKEAVVIGDTLGKSMIRANVSYLVWRVQCMIDAGKIVVLKTPDDQPMHRTIKRCKTI